MQWHNAKSNSSIILSRAVRKLDSHFYHVKFVDSVVFCSSYLLTTDFHFNKNDTIMVVTRALKQDVAKTK